MLHNFQEYSVLIGALPVDERVLCFLLTLSKSKNSELKHCLGFSSAEWQNTILDAAIAAISQKKAVFQAIFGSSKNTLKIFKKDSEYFEQEFSTLNVKFPLSSYDWKIFIQWIFIF